VRPQCRRKVKDKLGCSLIFRHPVERLHDIYGFGRRNRALRGGYPRRPHFFLIETWFGAAGVWYLIILGMTALLFSLFLPNGIWGYIEDRFQVFLLPVGYRVQTSAAAPIADPTEAHR
jgi:hypothetical protein